MDTTIDLDMLAYDIADTLDRGEYGMGDLTQDALRAALPAFLAAAAAHAARAAELGGWYPPADAPRNGAGDLIHTCNGDVAAGLGFGRRAPEGECARCDELRRGAAAREGGPRIAAGVKR